MRGRGFIVVLAALAASCSEGPRAELVTIGTTSQALGAPTKVKTFTTGANAASTLYGLGGQTLNDGWVDLGGKTVFSAQDVLHGKELWVTDGTAAGTSLLVDGYPGPQSSLETYTAHSFVSNGSVAIYSGATPEAAFGWRTDGTTAGTYPLRKIVLPMGWMKSSARLGTSMFVSNYANDVWKSDGTDAGTSNFWTGGYVYEMAAGTTKLFLASGVRSGCASAECLYVSDGTTAPVKVTGSPFPVSLTPIGDVLYYLNDSNKKELWKSDGTTASLVYTLPGEVYGIRPFGTGMLFFVNHTGVAWELWKSDGTTTELVSTITPSPNTGTLATVVGDKAYFGAQTPANGLEMWITDGTTGGTSMITDLYPGASPGAAMPYAGPAKWKDGVAFAGVNAAVGQEPFIANAAGVTVIADATAGGSSALYSGMHEGPGQTLFFAMRPTGASKGVDLWKSTAVGSASFVKSTDVPTAPAPSESVVLGNKLYFTSIEGTTSLQLWTSDGTGAGTTRVTTAADRTNVISPTVMGGKIYFTASKTGEGQELYETDGTEAGTVRIDVYPGASSAYPTSLTASGTHLFFAANSASGQVPYVYSAADGLVSLAGISAGSSSPSNLAAYKGGALFTAAGATWFSDGTLAGTVQISATPATSTAAVLGTDAIYGTATGLWKTDGTAGNTALVKAFGSPIVQTVAAGGNVYFAGDDGGLWKSDGTANNTTLVVDLVTISNGSKPHRFSAFGNKIVFVASDAVIGERWYVSDGTPAGTVKLTDAAPGVCNPYVAGATLYFCAADAGGEELWTSDGTAAGTQRWMDLNPGPYRSAPSNLALVGNKLFFTAYEGVAPSLYFADTGLPNPPPPMDGGTSSGASSGTSGSSSGAASSGSTSTSASSSGANADADATANGADDSGCGCRTIPTRRPIAWTALAIVAGLVAWRRRTRPI